MCIGRAERGSTPRGTRIGVRAKGVLAAKPIGRVGRGGTTGTETGGITAANGTIAVATEITAAGSETIEVAIEISKAVIGIGVREKEP